MILRTRIPLAWLNLMHDRKRLAISLGGVGFAVVLMFVELGFWTALFDSTVALIDHLDADLIIVSKTRYSLSVEETFPLARLTSARSIPGVDAAYPLYINYDRSIWLNTASQPQTLSSRPCEDRGRPRRNTIRAFGIDLNSMETARPVLELGEAQDPEWRAHLAELRLPDRVFFDRASRGKYGRPRRGTEAELAGQKVRVADTFYLGTDFLSDGNLLLGQDTFARYFSPGNASAALGQVSVGLIQVDRKHSAEEMQQALRRSLPDDVKVFTRQEFRDQELEFWRKSTPISTVFTLGLAMGVVVGTVICFLILSTEVADRLAEFATLKAIGYTNGYLNRLVMLQALLLALAGFVPACVVSWVLYAGLEYVTGLPLRLTVLRGSIILVLTVFMCMVSGFLALRKVRTADPAEVF
jgi:putative ABC transport system permease protein